MSFGRTNYRNGGTRGGADQFRWEDVKNDKYRENYLGHSLHAPVGRWQKDKDLTWYNKTSTRAASLQSELAMAKQRDEDMMNEALGIAPRRPKEPSQELNAYEKQELLKKGNAERDELDIERVQGLGAAPTSGGSSRKRTMAEEYQDKLNSGQQDDTHRLPGQSHSPLVDEETGEEMDVKKMKKLLKKEKKAKKKAKKRAKKEARGKQTEASQADTSHGDRSRDRRTTRSRSPARRSRQDSRSRSPRSRRRHESRSRSRSRDRSRRSRSSSYHRRR